MSDLLKQRAQRFVERRQEDVKDQADEFLSIQSGNDLVLSKNKFRLNVSKFVLHTQSCTCTLPIMRNQPAVGLPKGLLL